MTFRGTHSESWQSSSLTAESPERRVSWGGYRMEQGGVEGPRSVASEQSPGNVALVDRSAICFAALLW